MRSLRTDVGASLAASLTVLLIALGGGQLLVATTPATATAAPAAMTTCLDRPLTPINAPRVLGAAHLCLTVDDVAVTLELASAANGNLHTAWLSFQDHPGAKPAGACPNAPSASAQPVSGAPSQIDAAVAQADGTLRLSRTMPGLRPAGNTELEVLVVDHGPAVATATAPADRTRSLLSWDRAWSALPAASTARPSGSPRLVGCAAFWLRGGAEQTDH
jgi:hypothetical protein